MRIKTAVGLSIAGFAGALAIGGTAWAATGGSATPAEPAAPAVSEQPGTAPGWDCPEKQQGTQGSDAAL